MKVTDLHQNIEISGEFETTKFTANWSGHAAKLLSDNLYSNKILSFMREVSTNAIDSQIEAGSDKNPDVHLPTLENPNFIIRDWGTGLDDKQMNDLYTVYFLSSKQNSNKYTGFLGIGRVSPLSYNTKTFSIDAYKDGIIRSYSVYYGKDSVPVLSKLSEQPTDEANGLKITVPAKTSDIRTFKENAEELYRYFDIRPNFTGNIPDIKEDEIKIQGKDWYIHTARKKGYYSTTKEQIVVCGRIAYPLKIDTQDKALQALQNQNLVVQAPIGSVSIDMSREKLSYDQRTIDYLTKRLNQIVAELSKDVQQKVNKASCKYDAICEYWESPLKEIMKIDYDGVRLPQSSYDIRVTRNVYPEKIMVYTKSRDKAYSTRDLPYRRNILVLERDRHDVRPRINHLLSSYDSIYCIEFKNDKNKQDWLDDVGLLSIKKLSEYKPQKLPKVAGVTSGGKTKYIAKELKVDRWSWNVRRSWNGISELPKDYVMVELDSKYNCDMDFSTLRNIQTRLEGVGIKNVPTIVGVKEVEKGKHLKDWMKKELEKKLGKVVSVLPEDINENCVINTLKKKLKLKVIDATQQSLCKLAGIPTKEVDLSKYPLLEHISYHTPETVIEDYIDTIDKCVPHTEDKKGNRVPQTEDNKKGN